MSTRQHRSKLRDELILAGLEELSQQGYQNFSVRRIASKCDVSCAAPYKHFKDKQEFIAAIITYMKNKWSDRQTQIIEKHPESLRNQIIEIALEYVRFLVEYPEFRSILMQRDSDFDEAYGSMRYSLSALSTEMVQQYCNSVSMPTEVFKRKLFVIRSLIFGAALMFDNGEMEYSPENMKIVEKSIEREFDLE